ncbi:hypothetical protein HPB52_019106 [Rhipicephalus sanguineus]|uniref:Tick transposon n=1 Tax=Rhipicephalus sanguineus TaxID=34632 RepID=A0A9D4QF71_RHISA|nr:hypothetical protein HPB52_019106 [Rhipicephalus sanguineus]
MARATALTKGYANDPCAYYVDVAKYPHRPNAYAAAVIAADTGVLTTGSLRTPGSWTRALNHNEEADTEAHALTSRGSPSTHSSEPQRPDAEDEEYSITTYGDVLQWYRTSRRLYPPPHRDLQCSEAATLRQLQVQAIWTPVWAKHVCPEVYTTDICQHCKKAQATQRHLLWDCAPPPGNQEEAMPTAISSKIISREPGNQRDVVQHVLSNLERQRLKAAPPRV